MNFFQCNPGNSKDMLRITTYRYDQNFQIFCVKVFAYYFFVKHAMGTG